MNSIKDVSRGHRTILKTEVSTGRTRVTLEVCVPGRDMWAHQMAKIELQNRVLAERRKQRTAARTA